MTTCSDLPDEGREAFETVDRLIAGPTYGRASVGGHDVYSMEANEIEVQIWEWSALDGVRVVQIDTKTAGGRLRVNLNDAPIWDGDPESDHVPGSYYRNVWEEQHVSEEIASTVLDFFEGGRDPGHFASLLIRTILAADPENAEAIGVGMPEWCRAVGLWRSDKEALRAAAGR